MLETLAGGLKWERTGDGIRVVIPARLDWTTLFFVVWLAFWSVGGWHVVVETFVKYNSPAFDLLWLVGWAAGECFVTAAIVWSLAGRTDLALDSYKLEITNRLAGIQLSMRIFMTGEVRNLRYVPAGNRGRRYYQSRVKFEADGKTRTFGSGLEDIEAFALIDKMLQVHKFPKDSAVEYISAAP